MRPAPGDLSCNADADTVPSSQSPSLCPISLPSLLHLARSCSKPDHSLGPHCLHTCSCWAPGRMRGSLSPVSHRLNELPTASISADEQMSLLPIGPIILESPGPGFLSPNLHSMQTAPLSESAQNMSISQHPTAAIPSASPQLCPVPLEFIHRAGAKGPWSLKSDHFTLSPLHGLPSQRKQSPSTSHRAFLTPKGGL